MTTEKRADGKVETEATIKVEVDGERYVRRSPRATARSTRSTGRCAPRSPTATRTWPTSS